MRCVRCAQVSLIQPFERRRLLRGLRRRPGLGASRRRMFKSRVSACSLPLTTSCLQSRRRSASRASGSAPCRRSSCPCQPARNGVDPVFARLASVAFFRHSPRPKNNEPPIRSILSCEHSGTGVRSTLANRRRESSGSGGEARIFGQLVRFTYKTNDSNTPAYAANSQSRN